MAGMTFDPAAYRPVEHVIEEHRTNICGLSKDEYVALELTKAWASTRSHAYVDSDDIVDYYYEILEEVNARLK